MVATFSHRVGRAARGLLARLVLAGAAVAVLAAGAAPPVGADSCAYVTGGRAYFADNGQQQETIHRFGDGAFVLLDVRLSNGQTVHISPSADLSFFTDGAGLLKANGTYDPLDPDVNKTFPIYARYHDPCKNVTWTFTVSLHVIP